MYAIIETGGKQFKVTPGQLIDIERLDIPVGESVELDKVLLITDGDNVTVGKPTIDGAKVVATANAEVKGKKISVLTFKSKTRQHTKTGHRQRYTRLTIGEILAPGIAGAKPARKKTAPAEEEVTENGA